MKSVRETCYARVGLMGNPSDGFGGKTIAFLIKNFFAEVTIESMPSGNSSSAYKAPVALSLSPFTLTAHLFFLQVEVK